MPTAHCAKSVHIGMAFAQPAIKLNSELEAALCLSQEFRLVEAERAVEQVYLGNGGLANTDRADRVAFHQRYLRCRRRKPGQQRGRDPTGGPAASDHEIQAR